VWIILIAILISIALPFIWLWRRKWLKYNSVETKTGQ
jgi:hypothetical protein